MPDRDGSGTPDFVGRWRVGLGQKVRRLSSTTPIWRPTGLSASAAGRIERLGDDVQVVRKGGYSWMSTATDLCALNIQVRPDALRTKWRSEKLIDQRFCKPRLVPFRSPASVDH